MDEEMKNLKELFRVPDSEIEEFVKLIQEERI